MHRRNTKSYRGIRRHRHLLVPLTLVGLFLLGGAAYYFFMQQREADSTTNSVSQEQTNESNDDSQNDQGETLGELPSVQSELDAVLANLRGQHSVMLEDPETGKVLASHREDAEYFTASIYKLYVAYLGLIDIQSGIHDPDEPYNQGRTRLECIVVMLRDSDSPCPEQMWEEQGRDTGNNRLRDMGLTDTDLLAITTTTQDANTILKRLYNQSDLTADNTELFRDALSDYPEREFRQGLPSAFSASANVAVYNKPGLYDEGWLDAAIIELPNGRSVIVSIFSDSAYYQEVRTIADAVISPLIEATR